MEIRNAINTFYYLYYDYSFEKKILFIKETITLIIFYMLYIF